MWHEKIERRTTLSSLQRRRWDPWVPVASLLLALVGFAVGSSDATCRDHDDLHRILAARERIADHGQLAWPGWTDPPPVLLRSGDVDCLFAHPRPPDGFEIDGSGVTRLRGHLLPQPVATAWSVNGVWSVAVPARDELQTFLDTHVGPDVITLDAAVFERVIVHEAFHAHQMTVLGGPEGVPEFGRRADGDGATAAGAADAPQRDTSDVDNRPSLETLQGAEGIDAALRAQGRELVSAVTARTAGEAAAAAARFLDLRRAWRAVAPPGTDALEQQLEWLEGTARYVDVLLAAYPPAHPGVAADEAWEDLLAQLQDLPAIPTGPRDRYAALGAGQAFVLDRLYPTWKSRALPGGESLEALLQEAVDGRAGVPRRLSDLPLRTVRIGGERWRVIVAQDETGWTRGLQGVTSLGGVDGLLFVFPEEVRAPFWMRGASMPLDVAFFDREGTWLAGYAMATCQADADPCPTYRPDSPYQYALETTPGRFDLQMEGVVLDRRGW